MNQPVEEGAPKNRIALRSFSQRLSAWPDEDWSGITDQKTRRRLQNRLNQRIRRLQNKNLLNAPEDRKTKSGSVSSSKAARGPVKLAPACRNDDRTLAIHTANDFTSRPSLEEIKDVHILESDLPATIKKMAQLESLALQYYTLGSPRTDLLLHLVQFNFTRALIENTKVLGLTSDQMHDDAISPFNTAGPWLDTFDRFLPANLQPTAIQRSIPHHPWLDLLPVAQMRDNLILAGDFEEETQLCLDMKGCGSEHTAKSGIIVWSDPWDAAGWEITEPFARYWGWVIKDCDDLARSTNQWRAKRNERPLFFLN